jgi:toxin-antitoxin system PIN domain toxin
MIVPDANMLIYAYDATSPRHKRARSWWEGVLSGVEPVGIPWIVILAFVRLMTHPTLSANPMTVRQARDAVAAWLAMSHVRILVTTPRTLDLFFDLLTKVGTGGNLSTDAMIAALAGEHGGCIYSNDSDFGRFADTVWQNPLA